MKGYYKGTKIGIRTHFHKKGEKFGYLTIISQSDKKRRGHICWNCECICGGIIVVSGSLLRQGYRKSCGCRHRGHWKGPKSVRWRGGKYTSSNGYVYIVAKGHPNANKRGYCLEHTVIMSNHLGRPIKKGESVHHKNGVRDDNRIENLELCFGAHPHGQRVSDLVDFSLSILKEYAPELLIESGAML